jgi:hypothetical protein
MSAMTENSDVISTAFLRETVIWVDRHGNEHQLKDMTAGYLRHVLSFLRSIEDTLFAAEKEEINGQELIAVFEPWRYPDGHRSGDYPDARTWLNDTPLVKAVTALLDGTD